MVLAIILPILAQLITDPVNKYVVTPIKRHVSYAFKYDSNVQRLQQQVEQLQSMKDRLQHSVDEATRNSEHIFPNVSNWLKYAGQDMEEAEKIIHGKDEAMNKCFFGIFPNLKTRYQLSKISEKKALAIHKLCNEQGQPLLQQTVEPSLYSSEALSIDELCNEQGLDSVSFQPPLQQTVEPSLYSGEAFPSRVLILNQVMDALKDPDLHIIRVCGCEGVGKTTLAKEVQAKALQEKLFEAAVMVVVSPASELRRIQGDIAALLGMKLSSEEIPKRASQLRRRLEKSKILIILDDLWKKLDLNEVGIPYHGASEGFKVMLVSRHGDFLTIHVRSQKLFYLNTLRREETLPLFQMTVAKANDPEFHPIATQIVKKCDGLPLLIKIVATHLRNKESYVWKDMLKRLSSNEDVYKKVHRVLESIYDNLPGAEIKQFFLLCALFGQSNIQIQYLLTHGMSLGLFKHIFTLEAARDMVLSWIDELKDKCLLLDGYMAGYVNMQGIVQKSALSIAFREHHAFFGQLKVGLRDWPNKDCKRISLRQSYIRDLPVSLDCPEAEVFLLYTEDLSLGIPDPFFELMKKLKVVDLRGMRLVSIPPSIGMLTNLQTLCLHSCQLDNVSILGELKKLEFLSFANSNVVELPRVIERLTQLKLLDVTSCTNLQVIPAGVLSRLCSLEELYMLDSFVLWDSEGNASLLELENLARLSTLEIQIPDLNMIPVGFKCFNQLKSYKIFIGSAWGWDVPYERSRTLKLKGEARIHLEGGTELLLRESEDLYLDGVKGIQSIYDGGFPNAKHMHIENDFEIQYLINSTMHTSCNDFPQLKSLYLNKLHGLEKVCCGQHRMESFGELRILKISNCGNLTSLFFFSSGKFLQKLRELEVEFCENMEALVDERIEEVHHNNEIMEFTQLCSLKLKNLPQLLGFCKFKDETEQMGPVFSTTVCLPNLICLEVNGCKSLKHIFPTSKKGMEFTQLSYLKLQNLPQLIGFCELKEETDQMGLLFSNMVSFPNLTSLEVDGCKSLKHICTGSTIRCLAQLTNLKIKDCELDGEIIQSKKLEEIEEDDTELIVFPNLDCLSLLNLKNVKRFSNRYSFKFPLLTELTIEDCHTMGNFVGNISSMATFSNLERMDVNKISRDRGLLEGLQPLQNIKRINIKYYMNEELPPWMSRYQSPTSSGSFVVLDNLVDLKLEWCYNCLQLPCLGNLPHLTNLEMSHMGKLKCIHNEFYGNNNESYWNRWEFFPALKSLSVRWMENLTEWRSPSYKMFFILFPRLRKLCILSCPKLTSFPMRDLSELEWLEIKDCQELKLVIDEHKSLPSLASLSFEGCSKLTNLRHWLLPRLWSFELTVSRCEWLTFVPYDLQKVTDLTSLEIYCCRRLRYFPEEILSKLTKLKRLSIGAFSEELDDFCYLNRIKYLEHLEELEIWGSDFLGRKMCFLPKQLQHLSALKSLKVMGFTAMKALPEWLMNLQSLHFLSLDYCRNLGRESTAMIIQRLSNLKHLCIRSCPILQGSESEWLQPLHDREIEVELSHVSEVRVRFGY